MRRNPSTCKLTKDYIESKISQINIMSKYLNISPEIINQCVSTGCLIKSVFRDDDFNESMGFIFNKSGRLKVRDFGGSGFFEDIYGVVAYVLSNMYNKTINVNDSKDFYCILKHIANSFSDIIDGKEVDRELDLNIQNALKKGMRNKTLIELVPRNWNKYDKQYWSKLGIDLSYLNTNFVIPVEQYYLNRRTNPEPRYYYKESDPCYAYILGQNRFGVVLIKLYFPNRNRSVETKFLTNCNILEGLLNLEKSNYDYILITKSTKDRLSIGNYLHHLSYREANIGVINLPSESYKLREIEYRYLTNKLSPNGKIISLLDFDRTGRNGAKFLKETYNIPYLFITRGELGLINYKSKDFTDLHLRYTKEEIIEFINKTIDYVRHKFQ